MTKKVEEKKKVISEDGEDEEEVKVTTTDSTNIMKRTKRNEATTKNPPTGLQPQLQLSKTADSSNNLNNSTGKDNCVVQCILGQMGMVNIIVFVPLIVYPEYVTKNRVPLSKSIYLSFTCKLRLWKLFINIQT